MTTQKVAGTLALLVDGTSVEVGDGEFQCRMSGVKREPMPGTRYFSEKLENASIEGEVVLAPGFDPNDLIGIAGDATVQVQAANGSMYVLKHAFFSGDGKLNPSTGKMPVEFSAGPYDGEIITA